jgi:hypothetical protein
MTDDILAKKLDGRVKRGHDELFVGRDCVPDRLIVPDEAGQEF